jgi:predicted nucleic acid-binding Zn ribbon protein
VSPHRRGPRQLAGAFESLTRELAPQTPLAAVQRAWPDTVGPLIAAQAQPTAERRGVLTVSCSASVWAQELDLMAPDILARLNDRLDGAEMTRLRCVAIP